jgi:hypothetical protein
MCRVRSALRRGCENPHEEHAMTATTELIRVGCADTVLLVSFRRDGTRSARQRTSRSTATGRSSTDRTWKFKRMCRDPHVTVAPSTFRGMPLGPAVHARARLLEGTEAARAARLIADRHPILHGVVVPAYHRLRGFRTVHFELTALP